MSRKRESAAMVELRGTRKQQKSVENGRKSMKRGRTNKGVGDGPLEDLVRGLAVTRFSRLQVLKGLAAASALAMLPTALGSRSASAQLPPDQIEASLKDTGAIAYRTAWNMTYQKDDAVREFIVLRGEVYYTRRNPDATSDQIKSAADKIRSRYEAEAVRGETEGYLKSKKILDNAAFGIAAFGALSAPTTGGVNFGPLAVEGYNKFFKAPIEKLWEPINRFEATKRQHEYYLQMKNDNDDTMDEAMIYAMRNPEFAEAIDAQHQSRLGMAIQDVGKPEKAVAVAEEMILRLRPATQQKVRQKVRPDGSISMTKDELRQILKEELGGIEGQVGVLEEMMNESLATAKRIEDQQQDILAWQQNQDARRAEEAKRKAEAERHQLVLDGVSSSVYLLSALAGLADPKLGKEIMVVGNAAIQVYDAVEKFVDQLPKLAELGNLAAGMSGAIMTGNIVGAAMNVISLFQEQGPTPEQMIMDQIAKLGKQIQQMHEQMHERFDRIEGRLDDIFGGMNAIFDLVNAKFNQVAEDLDEVRKNVDVIQQTLARHELLLSRMGTSIHKGLQDGFRLDFNHTFRDALGYKEKNGEDMSLPQFNDWEGDFFTWAVDAAKTDNEMPVAGRSYEDDDLLLELTSYPLEENIMYLSNWLQRSGLPALAEESLANPVTWAISAEAYGQLRVENPKYAVKGTYPQRNAEVQRAGKDLLAALRKITVKRNTSSGPEPNHELFEKLTANLKAKAGELHEALVAIETDHLFDWKTRTLGRGAGEPDVDPWGGARQRTSHVPAGLPNPPTGPPDLFFVPAPYLLADYMKLDDPALNMDISQAEWVEDQIESEWKDPKTGSWEKSKSAILEVVITIKYGDTTIFSGPARGDRTDYYHKAWDGVEREYTLEEETFPDEAFAQQWPDLKERFEEGVRGTPPVFPKDHLNDITNRVEGKLHELRVAIFGKVDTELGDGKSLEPLTRRLDGANALVAAFAGLGMPVALEADDFLRAMLYGAQSLMDRGELQDRYARVGLRAPLGHHVSLRSHSQPASFVRKVDGIYRVGVAEIASDQEKQESTFKVLPGFVDADKGTVSLQSVSSGLHMTTGFLGSRDVSLGGGVGGKNETFSVVAGLADPKGISIKSLAHDRYLRVGSNGRLIADYDGVDEQYKPDATFHLTTENPRSFVKQDAEARADALGQALKGYLDLIGQKKHAEGQEMIQSVLIKSSALGVVIKALNEAPPDETAPTVGNVTPESGATGVSVSDNVTAAFSEGMDPNTLTGATFTLTKQGSSSPAAATVSYDAATKTATLNPAEDLAQNTTYTATIKGGNGGVKDAAGNALAQDKTWSFTTAGAADTTAPTVVATDPAAGAKNVPHSTTGVTITFSEKMKPESLNKDTVKLEKLTKKGKKQKATPVTLSEVSLGQDGKTVTAKPASPFAKKGSYRVTISTGATDEAGNALAQDKVWGFTMAKR